MPLNQEDINEAIAAGNAEFDRGHDAGQEAAEYDLQCARDEIVELKAKIAVAEERLEVFRTDREDLLTSLAGTKDKLAVQKRKHRAFAGSSFTTGNFLPIPRRPPMTDLCPAEIMAKAAHEEQNPDWPWERYKSEYLEEAEEEIDSMRIALRALAEMEPTPMMLFNHGKAVGEASKRVSLLSAECQMAGVKAFLFAAAEEGGHPVPALSEGVAGQEDAAR